MKIKFDYRKYLFLRVSTDHDEKSEFLTIDIILAPLFFIQIILNLTVEDGRQFTEACHDVGIWQKPNLGICPRDIIPFCKAKFRNTGFLVPFNGLMPKRIQHICD